MIFFLLLFVLAAFMYFVPAAALVALVRLAIRHSQRMRAYLRARPALSDAAGKLAFRPTRSSLWFGDEVRGTLSGLEVAIDQHYRARVQSWRKGPFGSLRIAVKTPRELPHRLFLSSRDRNLAELVPLGDPLRSFDAAFESAFVVYGRTTGVTARLDANLRRRLIELDQKAELLIEGDLIVAVTRQPMFLPQSIVKLVAQIVSLAQDLTAEGPDVAALLLTNAVGDPEVAVRFQNLDLLLRDFPGTLQAKEGLRMAWEAPERGIRYLAAIRMGDEGLAFLEETVGLTGEPIALRIMALRHLARHAPRPRVLPLLHAVLRAPPSKLRASAIELLGRLQDREAVPRLLAVGASAVAFETRLAITHALGAIGDARAESFLLSMLADQDLELKIAAASALGKAGSSYALGPLAKVAARYVGVRDLAQAANAASSRIETRIGPVERGQLSLVEVGALEGALSVPLADTGAVSIAREPGELSHPLDSE